MATFYSNKDTRGYTLELDVSYGVYNIANNTTPVTYALYLRHTNTSWSDSDLNWSINIGGQTKSGTWSPTTSPGLNRRVTIPNASGTFTITHDTNGTKTILISASTTTGRASLYSPLSHSLSGSMTLPTIPRYTTITSLTSSSVHRSGFTVSFTTANTIDQWAWQLKEGSGDYGSWTTINGDRTNGSQAFSGLKANTTYTINVGVRRKDSQLWTYKEISVKTLVIAKPTALNATEITRSTFKINVTADQSISGFGYSLDDGATWSGKIAASGTTGSIAITGRSPGTNYKVRVRVYDGVHTASFSGASTQLSVTTLSAASPNKPVLTARTGTTLNFNWSSNRTVTNVKYKHWYSDDWQSLGADFSPRSSGSIAVSELVAGTQYAIYISVKDEVSGAWSAASEVLTASTFGLSKITSYDTIVDTNSVKTLKIEPEHPNFRHNVKLQMWADNQSWLDIRTWTNTEGTTYYLSPAEVTLIENNRTTSDKLVVRYSVEHLWGVGGPVQGTSYSNQSEWTLVDVLPTLGTNSSYLDVNTNSSLVTWKGGNQRILRNYSIVRYVVGTANAIKGAKLSHAIVTVLDKSYRVNFSAGLTTHTGLIINGSTINTSGNVIAKIEIFDSRGKSVSRDLTIIMVNYLPPQVITSTTQRVSNFEKRTYLQFEAKYFEVSNGTSQVNSLTAHYRTRKKGTTTWSTYTLITHTNGSTKDGFRHVSTNQDMNEFDNTAEFEVEIRIKDWLPGYYYEATYILKGLELLAFHEDRLQVGVPIIDTLSTRPYLFAAGMSGNVFSNLLGNGSQFRSDMVSLQAMHVDNGTDIFSLPGGFYRLGGTGVYTNRPFPSGYLIVVEDNTNTSRKMIYAMDYTGKVYIYNNYTDNNLSWLQLVTKDSPPETVNLTLATGWTVNTGFGPNLQAKKDATGLVSIAGVVAKTTSVVAGEIIATLPEGMRPSNRCLFSVTGPNYVPSEIEVTALGEIKIRTARTMYAYLSLANIIFHV